MAEHPPSTLKHHVYDDVELDRDRIFKGNLQSKHFTSTINYVSQMLSRNVALKGEILGL